MSKGKDSTLTSETNQSAPGTGRVVLAFEASGGSASAAVMAGGRVLGESSHEARHGHADRLLVLARECLEGAGVGMERVTTLLAGRGPGSFTGIRVALAAAKGLALARGAEGYGLSSLEALAAAAARGNGREGNPAPRQVAALADTRRGSVFLARYSADGALIGPVRDLPREEVAGALDRHGRSWTVAGAGADGGFDWRASLEGRGLDAEFSPLQPSARHLCGLFLDRLGRDATDGCPLEPIYLSEPLLGPPGPGGVGP